MGSFPKRTLVFLEAKPYGICDYPEYKLSCVQAVNAEKYEPAAQVSWDVVIETNEITQISATLNKI